MTTDGEHGDVAIQWENVATWLAQFPLDPQQTGLLTWSAVNGGFL